MSQLINKLFAIFFAAMIVSEINIVRLISEKFKKRLENWGQICKNIYRVPCKISKFWTTSGKLETILVVYGTLCISSKKQLPPL